MRLIYTAHPFGGEQENVEKVEKIIKGLIHKHSDCTFYSPLNKVIGSALIAGSLYDEKGL